MNETGYGSIPTRAQFQAVSPGRRLVRRLTEDEKIQQKLGYEQVPI